MSPSRTPRTSRVCPKARPRSPGTTTRASLNRSEEHTSELQSRLHLVCRLLLENNNTIMVNANVERLLDYVCVASSTVQSAKRKDVGNPFSTLTPCDREIFRSLNDELHRQFLAT